MSDVDIERVIEENLNGVERRIVRCLQRSDTGYTLLELLKQFSEQSRNIKDVMDAIVSLEEQELIIKDGDKYHTTWMVNISDNPLVCEDGWHCDPECTFLKPSGNDDVDGKCLQDGSDLDWHDFFIANCVNQTKELKE